jgi:hypothetical protein
MVLREKKRIEKMKTWLNVHCRCFTHLENGSFETNFASNIPIGGKGSLSNFIEIK